MSVRSHPLQGAAALAFAALLALSTDAPARTIRVDVGDGNYPLNGQAWGAPETALGGASVLSGTLPFAINFGAGAQTGFCLYANGTIGFASGCGSVPSNVITPLAADWVVDPAATRIFELGSVTYSEGHLARGAIPPDPEDAPAAVRFHWNDVECASCGDGSTYSFQAIIIDMGNGDFDLEFNYLGDVPAGVGAAGFLLGAFGVDLGGPLSQEEDYDFQFRNGQLVTAAPVSEPAGLALLVIAAVAAGLGRRRSRG